MKKNSPSFPLFLPFLSLPLSQIPPLIFSPPTPTLSKPSTKEKKKKKVPLYQTFQLYPLKQEKKRELSTNSTLPPFPFTPPPLIYSNLSPPFPQTREKKKGGQVSRTSNFSLISIKTQTSLPSPLPFLSQLFKPSTSIPSNQEKKKKGGLVSTISGFSLISIQTFPPLPLIFLSQLFKPSISILSN